MMLDRGWRDAYLVLQREARERHKSMKQVAEAILLVDSLIGTGGGASAACF
jgi:AmiR/NasT family two-component response regulator